jgi:hypothetical protein
MTPPNMKSSRSRRFSLRALALACQRMKARARFVDSVRRVCRAARGNDYWRERYHLKPDGTVSPDGSQKYCEYAAVLARVVFGNRGIFSP